MMHKMRYILVFMLLMSIGHSNTYAQIIDLNIPMYNARVKLVDEFFARFNGVEKREDVSEKYSDRESNILMLFNLSQFKSKTDSLFLQAKSFAHTVTQKDIIVNYDDTCWYAKTKCHGHLGKDKVDFYLYLIVEQRGDNMYKWAITDAEGNIFNNSRTRKHKELYVLPNAHEQSFSILSRITNESNLYIDDYAINSYETDKLSVFLTLVRCGLLKIDYVSDVEFFFFQVPNYIFTVKHFERESMNVGWLISSLKKCDELDKAVLLSSIRHISPKAASLLKLLLTLQMILSSIKLGIKEMMYTMILKRYRVSEKASLEDLAILFDYGVKQEIAISPKKHLKSVPGKMAKNVE